MKSISSKLPHRLNQIIHYQLFLIKHSWLYLIFALGGGILMGLTVAPTNFWWLAWVALIPLFFTLSQGKLIAFFGGFLWGCGYHGLALFWITGIHPMTWMGVPWFNSLLIAIFCWLFITFYGAVLVSIWSLFVSIIFSSLDSLTPQYLNYHILKTNSFKYSLIKSLIAVTIWCILEKIWSFSPLWWSSLAYTQSPYNLTLLQLLQLSGITTITALIVAVNFFLFDGISHFRLNLNKYHSFLTTIIILILSHLFGFILYQQPLNDNPNKSLTMGIIQGNIPNEIKLYDRGLKSAIARYTQGYEELAKQGVELILTPETALPFFYEDIENNTEFYQAVKREKVPVLLGGFKRLNNRDYANSLFAINGEGKVIDRYDKIQLVPLGEYIPFQNILGDIIRRLSPLDTQLIAGKKDQILTTPFGKIITGICYDSAFSEIFRQQTRLGGEFIVTASNNAHYSDTMPSQHHAQDVMRAIETNRWMVRASNTGYSAIVNPMGKTLWISQLNEYETHKDKIYRRDSLTPYVIFGDWLMWLLIISTVIILVFGVKISLEISKN